MSPITFRPARRENIPLLIGIAGGTGSGKTYSALRLARGLAGAQPFAVIDTESGRALHYADAFDFAHADLGAPFTPMRYLEAIQAAEKAGYGVIVVDSMSHEWEGVGGMLEMQEAEYQRMGGRDAVKMTSWIKPKGEHRKFVNGLLQLRSHVILCFRAAEKVEMVRGENGKMEVVPKQSLVGLNGWVPICEKTLPFELTVSLLVTQDAPGIPKPIKLQAQHRPFVPLETPLTEATGAALGKWAAGAREDAEGQAADETVLQQAVELREEFLSMVAPDRRDDVEKAIDQNRAEHERAGQFGAHVAWLGAQVERFRAARAKTERGADIDLGAAASDTPTLQEA